MKVSTKFARGINPFTNQPVKQDPPMKSAPNQSPSEVFSLKVVKKAKKATVYTNPEALEICNDPVPASRAVPVNKYHQKFSQMKIGQGIRCTSQEVGKVAGAMRKFVESKKTRCDVKTMTNFPGDEGYGRVWMLPVPATTK